MPEFVELPMWLFILLVASNIFVLLGVFIVSEILCYIYNRIKFRNLYRSDKEDVDNE